MDSKKKMIIAISSFAIVLLATVVAIVAVLAAQTTSVSSTINISYQAGANVIGSVKASYAMEDTTKQNDNLGTVTFSGSETGSPATGSGSIAATGPLQFVSDTNEYCDFKFEFTNTSTVANYTATFSHTGTVEGITISHKIGNADTFTEVANFAALPELTVNMNNGTGTYIVRVSLASPLADATLSGTFTWNLTASR